MNLATAMTGIRPTMQSKFLRESALRDAFVLVVEDDRKLVGQIQDIFGPQVLALEAAGTLFEARRMIEGHLPGLVLLDRDLPDGDGIELCSELRAIDRCSQIPILFMSKLKDAEECVRSLRAGGDDYLPKPFHPEELFVRAGALLRRIRRLERLRA